MTGLRALWSSRPGKSSPRPAFEILSINGLDVIWRKSPRRTRSLALKIDKQGQIVAMTPVATRDSELKRFVASREAWIRRHLAQHQQLEEQKRVAKGKNLWFMGQQLRVENRRGAKNLIEYEPGLITVISRQAMDCNALDRRLTNWLRAQADLALPGHLHKLSRQTGLRGSGLQIKSYSARWGSCRHNGLIQLNWKLIKTPPEVIDYVIIHELSHLRHFNHSTAFWGMVAQYCPEYRSRRNWLKENGRLLISS